MTTRRLVVPVVFAAILGLVYALAAPHTADLAAQTARTGLFRRSGEVPFWTGWYGGISTAGYSLLVPPLLGLLGPVGLGALSIVGTGGAAAALLRDARRPILGSCGFAVMAAFDAASGRATFALGALIALLAVVAVERHHRSGALLAAVVATAASPVAGILLLVVAAALLVVDGGRRPATLAMVLGVLLVLAALVGLTRGDGGGYQPFSVASLLMAMGTALLVAVAPVGRRVRAAAAVTILALVLVFAVPSPIGANVTRLVVLGAAPTVLAAARLPRVPLVSVVVVAALLPLSQLRNDLVASRHGDASPGFVSALRTELESNPLTRDHRVEVVDTATHWPSAYLLPTVSLARGWERQTDESRDPGFYGRAPLTAGTYRRFLDTFAVGLVAVPSGVPLDYGSTREAALIAAGLPYLHQVWAGVHWRVYAVSNPAPLVQPPARVIRQTDTGLSLDLPTAGRYDVRIRWSPYLVIDGGQVQRSRGGQVVVTVSTPGRHLLHAVWRMP